MTNRSNWQRVFRRVAAVEWRSASLPAARFLRTFQVSGRAGWSDRQGHDMVARPPSTSGDPLRMSAPVHASAVLVGKFDAASGFRLRSFYPHHGVSLRLQSRGRRNGIQRSVAAYHAVSPHDDQLMPRLVDHHDRRPARNYLVEEIVEGVQASSRHIPDIAHEVARRLHRVQQGLGTEHRSLSSLTHQLLAERWAGFVNDHEVEPAVNQHVLRLIERDDLLEVGFGHGDLVASNIALRSQDIVLLDWEYAGAHPIAFDLGKLHVSTPRPEVTLDQLNQGLECSLGHGRGHYSFAEQVALGHIQFLSWYEVRRQRATASQRLEQLAKGTRRRLALVEQLLA